MSALTPEAHKIIQDAIAAAQKKVNAARLSVSSVSIGTTKGDDFVKYIGQDAGLVTPDIIHQINKSRRMQVEDNVVAVRRYGTFMENDGSTSPVFDIEYQSGDAERVVRHINSKTPYSFTWEKIASFHNGVIEVSDPVTYASFINPTPPFVKTLSSNQVERHKSIAILREILNTRSTLGEIYSPIIDALYTHNDGTGAIEVHVKYANGIDETWERPIDANPEYGVWQRVRKTMSGRPPVHTAHSIYKELDVQATVVPSEPIPDTPVEPSPPVPPEYLSQVLTHNKPEKLLSVVDMVMRTIVPANVTREFANAAGFPGEATLYKAKDEFQRPLFIAVGTDAELGWYLVVAGEGFLPTLLAVTAIRDDLIPPEIDLGMVVPTRKRWLSGTVSVSMFEIHNQQVPKKEF